MVAAACPRVAALSPWRASTTACRAVSSRRPSPIPTCPSLLVCRHPSSASFTYGPPSDRSTAPTGSSFPSPRFSYHVAASFTAKDRPYDPSTHVFHFNPYNRIQKPARNRKRSSRLDSGHDAFFVSRVDESGAVAFGVADGVGGWADSGVDPADFSHGLCDYMAAAAYHHNLAATPDSPAPLTARSLMHKGYEAVCHDPTVKAGGSTACVAIGAPDGSLDVANLGDSGFLQLRLNGIHAFSNPQIHDFNTPYQLSLVPPRMAVRTAAFGGNQLQDLPRDADVNQERLRHGDILIFATDGVLDNMFNQEIMRAASRIMLSVGAWTITATGGVAITDALDTLVQPVAGASGLKTPSLQSLLATELVTAAKRASMNTKVDGPFAKQVRKYYPNERWHGGKVDDICVVVVVVCENSPGDGKSRL